MILSQIAFTAGILSFFVGVTIFFVILLMFQKYFQRKTRAALFLTLSSTSLLLTVFSASAVYFTAGINLNLAITFQHLIYIFEFLSSIFLFFFTKEIFLPKIKAKWMLLYTLLGVLGCILLSVLESSEQMAFPDNPAWPALILKIEFGLYLLAFMAPVSISILIAAIRTSKRVEDPLYKTGFKIISIAQILILTTFFVDTIASIYMEDAILYALFLYILWILPFPVVVCYYLGFLFPDWFKQIITKHYSKK